MKYINICIPEAFMARMSPGLNCTSGEKWSLRFSTYLYDVSRHPVPPQGSHRISYTGNINFTLINLFKGEHDNSAIPCVFWPPPMSHHIFSHAGQGNFETLSNSNQMPHSTNSQDPSLRVFIRMLL